MGKCIDLTGQKFGRLTVIGRAESTNYNSKWLCVCECGNNATVFGMSLKSGKTKSCGCLQKEIRIKKATTHGMSGTRIHQEWLTMKYRCLNEKSTRYYRYGGRGITVCDEWLNDFQTFYDWAMANGYNDTLTIDRIDVNGNYEPSNCRWVDVGVQNNNTCRNHYITYNGVTHTIAEWARIKNKKYNTLNSRIWNGWDVEKALNTP